MMSSEKNEYLFYEYSGFKRNVVVVWIQLQFLSDPSPIIGYACQ